MRDQQAYGQAGSREGEDRSGRAENDVIPSEIVRCLTWILSEREPGTY